MHNCVYWVVSVYWVFSVYWVLFSYFQDWNITHLTFEEDPEPHGKEKDKRVKQQASEKNVKVIIKTSHTLYNLDE